MKYSLPLTVLLGLSVAGCAATPQPVAQEYTVAQASGGPNCRRLAQPGDTKIQIYCNEARPGRVSSSGGRSCRRVSRLTNDDILRFCGRAAEWEQFDTWAASVGITCRWFGAVGRRQEFCMTSAQWQDFEKSPRRFAGASAVDAPSWPSGGNGDSGGSGASYASSYGYFPAGGAIGSAP